MAETILQFNHGIAKTKPNSFRRQIACPFCNRESLTDILDTKGPMIWLKNKYPVLKDAFQTVLIETDKCDSELSEYALPYLTELLHFAVEKWLALEVSGRYQSVLFFKNHGPLSGGSIRHPHMQIVGLENVDYRDRLREEYFDGTLIDASRDVVFNLSTRPMIGFTEFNVVMSDDGQLEQAAEYIHITSHYILNHFNNKGCNSYNLFFYHWKNRILTKIVPRYPTTPLFIGYGLRQVATNAESVIDDIKKLYFNES
ncbi:DUF4931 domain-containing protein [Tuberibacillus calidus]|uniref:DUF4931 domain-containing protein n=1 Tax=Tuberibacillus calidus TaxID=340097 RepID=UPI00040611AF|nr:DUF4931 domain-containing protein [Tuberibacillus calidus]